MRTSVFFAHVCFFCFKCPFQAPKVGLSHFSVSFHLQYSLYHTEKSSLSVAEQCAWALGNVAGEGEELRNVLLSQGALLPLARMMLPDKGSTVRTAAWALSNLIKVATLYERHARESMFLRLLRL